MAGKKRKSNQSKQKKQRLHFGEKVLVLAMAFFVVTILGTSVERVYSSFHIMESDENVQKTVPAGVKDIVRITPPNETLRIPILMYHYVEFVTDPKDTIRQSLSTFPSLLESQIQTLINGKYTFMTAGDVGEVLAGRRVVPKNPVVLTFDDGYRDFYTDAYPILKQYGVPATLYVIPGVLDDNNYLTKEQLHLIGREGLIEIAAHTMNHRYLTSLSVENAKEEIIQSKIALQQYTNKSVVSFAYPYGAFDEKMLQLVEDAGFTNAVSTIPGIEVNRQNKFFLSRLRPGLRVGDSLLSLFMQNAFSPW